MGEGLDYEALAQGVAEMREAVGAFVAALKTDGFSDEQARDIVTGFFRATASWGDYDA